MATLCSLSAFAAGGRLDRALRRTIEILRPRLVVGVGQFAESRARNAIAGMDVAIGRIPHPSPASPRRIAAGPRRPSAPWGSSA